MQDQDLRDQFAMAAMQALIPKYGDHHGFTLQEVDVIKYSAFSIADAMMDERAKSHPAEMGDTRELVIIIENTISHLNQMIHGVNGASVYPIVWQLEQRVISLNLALQSATAKQSSE